MATNQQSNTLLDLSRLDHRELQAFIDWISEHLTYLRRSSFGTAADDARIAVWTDWQNKAERTLNDLARRIANA